VPERTGTRALLGLIRHAEVGAIAKPGEAQKVMNLLRLDRDLLERIAVRDRNITAYGNRRTALGLK
jgi:hypothetical protein